MQTSTNRDKYQQTLLVTALQFMKYGLTSSAPSISSTEGVLNILLNLSDTDCTIYIQIVGCGLSYFIKTTIPIGNLGEDGLSKLPVGEPGSSLSL